MNLISDASETWSVKRTWKPTRSPTCVAQLARATRRATAARRDPPRLRAADHARVAATRGEAQLGQLRRLARAGLAREHDDLVLADQPHDLVGLRADRQAFIDRDPGHTRGARIALRGGSCDLGPQCIELGRTRRRTRGRKPPPARQQATEIARHHMIERAAECREVGHRWGLSRRMRRGRLGG